jgi:hypothetical protein
VLDDESAVPVITSDAAARLESLQTWLTAAGYGALAAGRAFAALTLLQARRAGTTVGRPTFRNCRRGGPCSGWSRWWPAGSWPSPPGRKADRAMRWRWAARGHGRHRQRRAVPGRTAGGRLPGPAGLEGRAGRRPPLRAGRR